MHEILTTEEQKILLRLAREAMERGIRGEELLLSMNHHCLQS
jgi:hypothetical protein